MTVSVVTKRPEPDHPTKRHRAEEKTIEKGLRTPYIPRNQAGRLAQRSGDNLMPSSNPRGSGSRGPWGSGPQPDLEEFLRRSQDKLRSMLPGNLGGRGIALIALAAIALWSFSGFFRVEPDELGVVLRFGKFTREVQPGLNYHLPYPIETALTPQALRVNKMDIGMRVFEDRSRGATVRDEPEESLMLTGDENIGSVPKRRLRERKLYSSPISLVVLVLYGRVASEPSTRTARVGFEAGRNIYDGISNDPGRSRQCEDFHNLGAIVAFQAQQQIGQLGNIDRYPSRLIAHEPLCD
jgi:Bacterial membrane protein N terminal